MDKSNSFAEEMQERTGEPLLRCYFCQKCTAGCPTAFAMDIKPAQVVKLIQLGQKDVLLHSSAPWLCIGCETCGTRCPNGIRLAPIMDELKYMALAEGVKPAEPTIYALHRSFLNSIALWGRVHEATMLAEYKMRLAAMRHPSVFADLPLGLTLFLKGKLRLLPERIKGMGQVKELYKRAKRR